MSSSVGPRFLAAAENNKHYFSQKEENGEVNTAELIELFVQRASQPPLELW